MASRLGRYKKLDASYSNRTTKSSRARLLPKLNAARRALGKGPTAGIHPPRASKPPKAAAPPALTAPVSSAGVAAPEQQPLPYNSNYVGSIGDINKQEGDTQAQINQSEASTKQQYGFDDQSNPYSRAKLLEQSYNQAKAGIGTSYAARGQLYSGATQNAYDANTSGYNQNYNSLRTSYNTALQDFANQRVNATNSASSARRQAEADALQAAMQQDSPDPGAAAPEDPGGDENAPAGLSPKEYSRRLAALRKRYGSGSGQVQRFRQRQGH